MGPLPQLYKWYTKINKQKSFKNRTYALFGSQYMQAMKKGYRNVKTRFMFGKRRRDAEAYQEEEFLKQVRGRGEIFHFIVLPSPARFWVSRVPFFLLLKE